MLQILAADIRKGDVILPPARELRLWMRRNLAENNLPESYLHITVDETYQDGRWLWIRGTQHSTAARNSTGTPTKWSIKALPSTKWPVVMRAVGMLS